MTIQKGRQTALSSEVLNKIRDLLTCCTEYPVESPQVASKVLELSQVLRPEDLDDEFTRGLLEGFGNTWGALLKGIPYLSGDQREQVRCDMERLFEEWEKAKMHTLEELESAVTSIESRVRGWGKDSFGMHSIPRDAGVPEKEIAPFVQRVIEEIFGPLMQNLPLVVRIQKEALLARLVKEFIGEG